VTAPRTVAATQLRRLVSGIFARCGVPAVDAAAVAEHLVLANLRGVDSHGVSRVPVYVQRLRAGLVVPVSTAEVERDTPVSAVLDGRNGLGIVLAAQGMRLAVAKAMASGIGMVSVRRSNHCGMLAPFAELAAARGLIGLAATSAPANVVAHGAGQPFFGTNPLCYAIPTSTGPVVCDMATSQAALGKLIAAERAGERIPIGWAVDHQGRPTDDPAAGLRGALLPMAGPKGTGLALLVEMLTSILSGGPFGPHIPALYDNPDHPQQLGHFFLAVRPELFLPPGEFADRAAELAAELRALPPAAGVDRVVLPGDPETATEARRRVAGSPLPGHVDDELRALAVRLGVPTPTG
jgi:LDH2 family malate/lactate/ureidoglycolate dehydrogenase